MDIFIRSVLIAVCRGKRSSVDPQNKKTVRFLMSNVNAVSGDTRRNSVSYPVL